MGGSSTSGNFLGSSTGSLASGFNLGAGNTTGSFGGGRGGTNAVGATSFLGSYYSNPIAMGLANSALGTTTTTTQFGSPMYNLTTTTTGTQTYNIPGRGTVTATITTPGNMINGLGNGWQGRRPVAYRITTDIPRRNVAPAVMRTDLQAALARSTRLSNPSEIRVVMDGSTVVLKGRVKSQSERRLAEGLLALEPRVGVIRNELEAPADIAE
jgi:hypothetical protein